jgi:hypothetical protein
MRTEVAKRLYVGESDVLYSQAVSMQGGNACLADVTVMELDGTTPTLNVQIQISNDLQNWESPAGEGSLDITDVGYDEVQLDGIAAAYVRLRYMFTGGTTPAAVIAAGIHGANL